MSKRSKPRKSSPSVFSLEDLEAPVGRLYGGIAVLGSYIDGNGDDGLAWLALQLTGDIAALRNIIYRRGDGGMKPAIAGIRK